MSKRVTSCYVRYAGAFSGSVGRESSCLTYRLRDSSGRCGQTEQTATRTGHHARARELGLPQWQYFLQSSMDDQLSLYGLAFCIHGNPQSPRFSVRQMRQLKRRCYRDAMPVVRFWWGMQRDMRGWGVVASIDSVSDVYHQLASEYGENTRTYV